jgi:hypothetical protein
MQKTLLTLEFEYRHGVYEHKENYAEHFSYKPDSFNASLSLCALGVWEVFQNPYPRKMPKKIWVSLHQTPAKNRVRIYKHVNSFREEWLVGSDNDMMGLHRNSNSFLCNLSRELSTKELFVSVQYEYMK